MLIIKRIEKYAFKYNIDIILTRFSPEPSGILHLGHLKCIYLNLLIIKKIGGNLILRFDDTNPFRSKFKYVKNAIEDLKLIGLIKYFKSCSFSSDYFNVLYIIAKIFIKKKYAYIEYKNIRLNYKKSFKIFKLMYIGIIKPKVATLKSNITTISKNNYLKNNVMYRVLKKTHFKSNFFLFPTYNFSHCIIDSIERITFSICSKEFENFAFFYNWYKKKYMNIIENYNKFPKQLEFSKLKIENSILSKRYMKTFKNFSLKSLINRGFRLFDLFGFLNNLSYSKEEGVVKKSFFVNYFIKNLKCDFKIIVYKNLFFTTINKKKYCLKKSKSCFCFFKKQKHLKLVTFFFRNIFNNCEKILKFYTNKQKYNSIPNNSRVFVYRIGIFIKKNNILLELLSIK